MMMQCDADSFERDINEHVSKLLLGPSAPLLAVRWIARATVIDTTRSVIEHISYIVHLRAV